jgi:hypothetical protein
VAVEDVVDVHHRRHVDHPDREASLGLLQTDEAYGAGSPGGILGGLRRSLTGAPFLKSDITGSPATRYVVVDRPGQLAHYA